MGMCTADWRKIPPSRVLLDSLIPSQEHLSYDALLSEPESFCGDHVPHAVLWGGSLYVQDGHHRVARAKLRGEQTIHVLVAVQFHHFGA